MTNENEFLNDPVEGEPPQQPQPTPPMEPQTGTINLQHIRVNQLMGPLVIFFGPRNVGKTVTLLRLCAYLSRFDVQPDPTFRTDSDVYQRTIDAFQRIRVDPNHLAPDSTGNIDFLLLNVNLEGELFCQILEAPGEHFFDAEKHGADYPTYLNQIFAADYRKIFVLFFDLAMFPTDASRQNYADKITRLINSKVSASRDRVIIVVNKCDKQSYIRNQRPVVSQYRKALLGHDSLRGLISALSRNGFRRVPFVPFSSGTFNDDGEGRRIFSFSPEHYPRTLWDSIHECVEGRPWWKFW